MTEESKIVDPQQRSSEPEDVQAARQNEAFLRAQDKNKIAKLVRRRWKRLEPAARKRQAELKVNFLRYRGEQFVQVHPKDPNRVWHPPSSQSQRTPPNLNKIRRSVHRYASQVTADEPIIEAVPATHDEEDRDAAEAATHGLRGEWQRMNLQREFQRAAQLAGIFRSAFWFFEWDETDGGKTKAQKYILDEETNRRELRYVNSSGEPVESEDDAADIWKGNLAVEVMTPMNVRWTGGRYAHDADELMVAKLVPLRELLATYPEARNKRLESLLSSVPTEAEKWLQDIRGEEFSSGTTDQDEYNLEAMAGSLGPGHALLDEPVFLLHYFRPETKTYPGGFHSLTAGDVLLYRKRLRYGTLPIAHFKLIDEVNDPTGLGVVDLVKDPQELLDFVRGQILRHLQMMRRRWFLPQQSNVSVRDLMNGTRSVIEYNAKAGRPEAETQPEIPQSIFQFLEQSEEDYDDILGIHALMKGRHVPGVQSGRHAEALQQGDETLLGLTREQLKTGLEQAGRVILKAIKKEWTTDRRVRYQGEDRAFIDRAFSRTDFGDTGDVRLKESTLLMLTKSQRLETIFAFGEMGALTPEMIRRLAPLADTAGLQLDEDEHIQRARRQNERFLKGPTDKAKRAWETFRDTVERVQRQLDDLPPTTDAEQVQPIAQALQQEAAEAEEEFRAVIDPLMPEQRMAERTMPEVAVMHAEQHAVALASQKVERLPTWWVEYFEENHFAADTQTASPPQQGEGQAVGGGGQGGEQGGIGGGMGGGEIAAMANPGDLPAPGLG